MNVRDPEPKRAKRRKEKGLKLCQGELGVKENPGTKGDRQAQ